MTTVASVPPAQDTPTHRIRGFLTATVCGAAVTALIGGLIAQRWNLIILSLVLLPAYGILYALVTTPSRRRRPPVVQCTALAMIESLEAAGAPDDDGDVTVKCELSVVSDDGPGFRVEIREYINLLAVPQYQPRGIVVVQYRRDRPWKARILTKPTSEWAERAAATTLDSVPGPVIKNDSSASCGGCLLVLLGLAIGTGAILGLFHSEIHAPHKTAAATNPPASSTTTTTTTTTTYTSDIGTVTLGSGQSMLDPGELQTAVQSVTQDADNRKAVTLLLQDTQLTVVFVPGDVKTGFDLGSVPYDRIPALVQQAKGIVGIGTPQSWQVTATGTGGSVTIKVMVTGDKGTGYVVANVHGTVISRSDG